MVGIRGVNRNDVNVKPWVIKLKSRNRYLLLILKSLTQKRRKCEVQM